MSNDKQAKTLQTRALALFTHSLEQPQAQRDQWLQQQCIDEPELLQTVRRLAAADRASQGFLESGPVHVADTDRSGERVGAFELTAELARGGMGTVYRGRRADGAFTQDVAIKLFRSELLDDSAMARFNTERQILARLEHPGIARLIDGGTATDGTPYVVMELVDGEHILRYCNQHSLDLAARLQLFQSVCEAMGQAHRHGIVHRDIKPGNILINADGQPKLLDFGIAKVLDPDQQDISLPVTRLGNMALTPEYASPEQVRGDRVSVSSDIYSLGVLLYELVTGKRPYAVETLSPAMIERTVCDTIPVDPSKSLKQLRTEPPSGLADARQLRRKLRGDVDRIIMTALRKQPGQRYASAAAFANDIERYLTGQPVKARGASRWYRAGKFVSRHRAGVAATAFAFVILLMSLLVVTMQAREAERQRDTARQQAVRAESAKQFLVDMIGQSNPFTASGSISLANALKQAIPTIGEHFSNQPELEAEMRYVIGFALLGQANFAAAREQLEKSLRLYQIHGSPKDRAEVLNSIATLNWDESDYSTAERYFQQAMDWVADDHSIEGRQTYYGILVDYGGLLPKINQPQRSIELLQQAQTLLTAEPTIDVSLFDQAVMWNNLATAYDLLEDYPQSIAAYEKSIELHRRHKPDGGADLAITLGNLGMTYEYLEQMDKAIEYVRQSAELQQQMLGPEHPQTLLSRYNLGSLLLNAGDIDNAIATMRNVVEMSATAYPEGHLYPGRFNHRLAMAYAANQQFELARQHATQALQTYAQIDDVSAAWVNELQALLDTL